MMMREHFLLDPSITFLNHGSFGACPRVVFETYQRWQLELEREPVAFYQRRANDLLDATRERVARYLGTSPHELIFVPNATVGVNTVAHSLDLHEGDEVLMSDHEYGAMVETWERACQRQGAHLVQQPIALPFDAPTFIEQLWAGVTERTRVLFISHITSPTALIFPLQELCARARAHGILTVVDGAHAPGQIPLDLDTLNADFYTGNFHKWVCAPKSAGFLYIRDEHHDRLRPLIVSWGWTREGNIFEKTRWQGTQDLSAYLTIPAALDFQEVHQWEQKREACHQLALQARDALNGLFAHTPVCAPDHIGQMVACALPPCDAVALQDQLYDHHRIEVPIIQWQGRQFVRVSIQTYNTEADVAHLTQSLRLVRWEK